MPTIDEKKRLEELKAEIRQISSLLIWTENSLRLAVDSTQSVLADSLTVLDTISNQIKVNGDYSRELFYDFKAFVPLVHEDLKAISESTISSSSSIKESISSSNATMINKMDRVSAKNIAASAVPQNPSMGGVGAIGGLLPPTLMMKVELVLDATAKFLKNWSNPVTVGIALGTGLAIPVVAGLAVVFGGYYLILTKISDSISSLSDEAKVFMERILDGGIFGLAWGKRGMLGSIIGSRDSEGVSNEAAEAISGAIEASSESLSSGINGISDAVSHISDTNAAILNNLNAASFVFRNILAASSLSSNRLADVKNSLLSSSRQAETKETAEATTIEYDTAFQNDLMSLLNSTISVRVENIPEVTGNREQPAEVFSRALKPLTDNQDALLKSLDSGLRKLSESVLSLREAGDNRNVSLMSMSMDSSNARISDASEQYLLEVTRNILDEVHNFYNSFDEYKAVWLGINNNTKKTSSSTEPTSKPGD